MRLRVGSSRRGRCAGAMLVVLLGGVLTTRFGGHHGWPHAPRAAAATVPVLRNGSPAGARGVRRGQTIAERQGAAVDRVLSYTSYVTVGSQRRREVALTFDDGPSHFTRAILTVLRRGRAPATFFEIGRQAASDPSGERAVLRAGMPIGDHTWTHPYLSRLSRIEQHREIQRTAVKIKRNGAVYPRLFRPPYGAFDAVTLSLLRRLRMLMVLWTVDTRDFARPGVQQIISSAVQGARPGAIVLMHDGGGDRSQTVAALPAIIRRLRQRRYTLVSVPRLLSDDPPSRHQRLPRSLAAHG
jgi:peptidoglycan-N-acetylglucosamine deacetylase